MASKKIPIPKDFANRINCGTRDLAKYVLASEPFLAYITVYRTRLGDEVYVHANVGLPYQNENDKNVIALPLMVRDYDPVKTSVELTAMMYKAREDILEFLRGEVVRFKATLNAAKK